MVADTLYMLTQTISGRSISLEEHLSADYPAKMFGPNVPPSISQTLLGLSERQFLAYSDLVGVAWLSRLAEAHHLRLAVRHARQTSLRELGGRNLIIFGSAVSNPWAALYCKGLNYQLTVAPLGAGSASLQRYFQNRQPQAGEPDRFVCSRARDGSSTDYALIAVRPNPAKDGNVLLIHGSMAEGTEAAALFLSDPGNYERLRKALGHNLVGGSYFEALIRVRALAGSTRESEIVAVRSWRQPK